LGIDLAYDTIGFGYTRVRREDPRIAARIRDALGDARTVLNVGAGAGAYEPEDLDVTAVEPSEVMRGQRPPGAAPAIDASAEELPFPDDSFDAVTSVFGTMFAPDHAKAAAELLRVCRPGGTIALASWTPDGFIGELFRTVGAHVPPPAGVQSPMLWGTEERLRELFGDGIASLRTTRRSFVFRYRSPEHWLEAFRTTYGPTLKAFEAVGVAGEDALAGDLLALARRFNQSGDETLAAPAEYLEAVLVKHGAPTPDRDHPEDWR
jgi:SAM-dependent methyltransferase